MKVILQLIVCLLPLGLSAYATNDNRADRPSEVATEKSMETTSENESMQIVGIELRTTNERAFTEIPLHWRKFYQEGVLGNIPNKVSRDVYAVYTNFENEGKNNLGVYSLIIGAQVKNVNPVPPQFALTEIPKSKRRVFPVETGRPEKVGEKWQEIWKRSDLKKTYASDYERYQESGRIDIFVGIE